MAGYDFFDLKYFVEGADPLVNELGDVGTLFYKVCDVDAFALTAENFALSTNTEAVTEVPTSCSEMTAGHGYIVDGSGECTYSFGGKVDFEGTKLDATDEDDLDYIGYTLAFSSD